MNQLIYQVSVGKPSKLYEHCIQSVADYCEEHNIDHVVQKKPKLFIKPDPFNCGRSKEATDRLGYLPIFEKENAFEYLNDYDQVAIIDADIWMRPGSSNIFDDVDPNVDFAGVVEREMPITKEYGQKLVNYTRMQYGPLKQIDWDFKHQYGGQFFNMGMMVLNKSILHYLNGQTPKEFISRFEFKDFVDGVGPWKWSTDQTLLNFWVRNSGMSHQKLHWRWNGLFKGIEDKYLDEVNFIHFFLKSKLPGEGEDFDMLMKNVNDIGSMK